MRPEFLVLVVEDDMRTARLLARMLEDDGFRVELRFDGAAAMQRLSQQPPPDVLVTDFLLPLADGRSIFHGARRLQPKLPVIVITGHPQLAAGLSSEGGPTPLVLTKPFDYGALHAEISRVVGMVPPSQR